MERLATPDVQEEVGIREDEQIMRPWQTSCGTTRST